jgi:hypothetical protein
MGRLLSRGGDPGCGWGIEIVGGCTTICGRRKDQAFDSGRGDALDSRMAIGFVNQSRHFSIALEKSIFLICIYK